MRVMAVCHAKIGIGQLQRTLAIAERSLSAVATARWLVVSGSPHLAFFDVPAGVDLVKLPSLSRGPDNRDGPRTLGVSLNETVAIRSSLLAATAASFRPDVVLVDHAPLGYQREMEPALRLVREKSPASTLIFILRDIEEAPDHVRAEWQRGGHLEALRDLIDETWVLGDPRVQNVVDTWRLPQEVAERIRYLGYVVRPPCGHGPPEGAPGTKRVLVTVGSGTDGYWLLDQYLSIAPAELARYGVHSTLVAGPDMPRHQAEQLRRRAEAFPNTRFLTTADCMSCEYRRADLVVCKGGYNTLTELLSIGRPMLVLPTGLVRSDEQMRAERFAELFGCSMLDPETITPRRLHEAVAKMLGAPVPRPPDSKPDLGGAEAATRRLVEIRTERIRRMSLLAG